MPLTPQIQRELFSSLLRGVSRSFFLTLRWLPAAVRPQIGLAYLLARATDTIADTELVPVEVRLEALEALRDRILGRRSEPVEFSKLAIRQTLDPERRLLEHVETAVRIMESFAETDRQLIREVIRVITSGQELDMRRFAEATSSNVLALRSDAELVDYTFRVAGCVGEFWTRICRAHLFSEAKLDDRALLESGVKFGQGLQMVNILRDLPRDLRQGRCYLPEDELRACGLQPADLLRPEHEPRLRPYYNQLLERTNRLLRAGWNYTNALPRSCVRVRLACAWPVLIGVQTLGRLRHQNVLDAGQRIKIARADVRRIVVRSITSYPWQGAWEKLFDWAAAH